MVRVARAVLGRRAAWVLKVVWVARARAVPAAGAVPGRRAAWVVKVVWMTRIQPVCPRRVVLGRIDLCAKAALSIVFVETMGNAAGALSV